MEIYTIITKIIEKELGDELKKSVIGIGGDEDLYDYGIDSLNIIKVVLAIETKYDIEFDDDEMNMENFRSVQNIAKMIKNKLN